MRILLSALFGGVLVLGMATSAQAAEYQYRSVSSEEGRWYGNQYATAVKNSALSSASATTAWVYNGGSTASGSVYVEQTMKRGSYALQCRWTGPDIGDVPLTCKRHT